MRLCQEPGAECGRARSVEPARVGRERQRRAHHGPAVDQDLPGHDVRRGHNGQHRHLRCGVVLPELHGQRPEVRRRPEEDDREQNQRWPRHPARHRRPADQHGEAARCAADHDVRRGPALQPERVDEHIEQQGRVG